MNYNKLEELSYQQLKDMAEDMCIKIRRTKEEMLKNIIFSLKEYETYKKNH
jgi:hypothetical protein